MRLQKYLASCGVASRRRAEELIRRGEVKVNGVSVTVLGTRVDPGRDRVEVGGRILGPLGSKTYLLLNKPRGVLCTVSDPFGRPTVMDLLGDPVPGLFPVGRLDFDSEGLLLLTNDGDLAWAVTHPSHRVPKTYLVTVAGLPDATTLGRLAAGVRLSDGMTAPAEVRLAGTGRGKAWLEMTLHEGKKRQIRRMCAQVGHPVLRLLRTGIGPIVLGGLAPGRCRHLRPQELAELSALVEPLLRKKRGG